jgi:putative copper resistance protein D
MGEAVNPWLHILAATVWVGPQIFLFVAAIPAVRSVEDAQQRARALRILTQRFGYLALAAFVVLLITGIGNMYEQDESVDVLFDRRWGTIFEVKMTLVIITAALTALHAFVLGPRLMRMQEANQDEARVAGMRRVSIMVSAANALLAFGILFSASLLDSSWSQTT